MFDLKGTQLPPTATPLARALDILEERLFSLPVQMITKDPASVDVGLLDHLAWEHSVDVWDLDWPEDVKRSVIAASAEVHRHKGTPYAIRAALAAFDVDSELLEWFEPEGVADGMEAGSFRVTAYAGRSLYGPTENAIDNKMVYAMTAVVQRVAPVSRKLIFRLGERFGVGGNLCAGMRSAQLHQADLDPEPRPFSVLSGVFPNAAAVRSLRSSEVHFVRRSSERDVGLWGRIGYGQSTMGPSGQEPEAGAIIGSPFPDKCFQPNVANAYGTEKTVGDGLATIDAADLTGIAAAEDIGWWGENFPMTLTGWALEHIWRHLEAVPTPGQIGATCWEGGAGIWAFPPGSSNFANVEVFLNRWDALAASAGEMADAPMLHWTQGEGGGVTYEADLRALFDALDEAWHRYNFPAPAKIALQVNLGDNVDRDRESRPAIVKLAKEGRCVLAGPMYIAPLADNIHPGQFGDVLLASISALAEYRVRKGLDTDPLWIVGGVVDGDRVRIKYHLPTHCAGLEINTEHTPAIKDAGFVCEDGFGPLDISLVSVTAADEITLVFSRAVKLPLQVSYAVLTMDETASGWANGIGNVICVSSVPSLFAGNTYSGRVVPDFILQPAIAETVTIGET
ncbi:phage tail protein I [Thalassovita aquimarina]|uniref:Phage tail protein I n=1 Tax=Thalassovita aquimarina TaxID=2785917 RepID=A0ABS5HSG2_9RHOB|nr:phage tail protein I [Thalassovita aquimarina]MBR9651917.1 phage tail protein I [Thalassovita aquimarina]